MVAAGEEERNRAAIQRVVAGEAGTHTEVMEKMECDG